MAFRPPLIFPSQEDFHTYSNEWGEYVNQLKTEWDKYSQFDFKQNTLKLQEEEEDEKIQTQYGCDDDRIIIKLADDHKNWRYHTATDQQMQDLTCYNTDTCWYKGNLDRRGEYDHNYILKGTSDVILCDICFNNSFYEWLPQEAEDNIRRGHLETAKQVLENLCKSGKLTREQCVKTDVWDLVPILQRAFLEHQRLDNQIANWSDEEAVEDLISEKFYICNFHLKDLIEPLQVAGKKKRKQLD